jgi:multicomponent Na+:H+ antiporter subunit D
MTVLLVLPIVLPLGVAAASLLLWRWPAAQRWLGVAGAFALLVVSLKLLAVVRTEGIQCAQIGAWPAPFGISIVADTFSAMMVMLAALMGAAVAAYSVASIESKRESYGYYPLLNVLLMGVCGAFLTGDIFNLYVCFEVMLMSSFVLLTLGGTRAQIEGAIKYVTLNLVASAFFLAAVGILYGLCGTLNMADLAARIDRIDQPGLLTVVAMMFLVAFGVKAAAFPLFFWLPASYHTPPVAVSAVFAGLLTKVGVYSIIRVFTLVFRHDTGFTHTLILVMAGLTMVTGVLGATAQQDIRRILSFHIVSQIGYMLMGLGMTVVLTRSDSDAAVAGASLALSGSIFYIAHHIIVKTNLFLIGGVVERIHGTGSLKSLGGLYRAHPWLSVLFLVPAMSLAGIPPLSGFWAKFMLVRAGLQTGQYVITATALVVGLLTLFSMTKIWAEAFWKPLPAPREADPAVNVAPVPRRELAWLMVPIAVLAMVTLGIGLAPWWLMDLATQAAAQLQDPGRYIDAVLGGTP